MENSGLAKVSCLLIVVGAINWGLVGLGGFMGADWNVVHMLLGSWPQVEWVVYILVGLGGVYKLSMCASGKCGCCKKM